MKLKIASTITGTTTKGITTALTLAMALAFSSPEANAAVTAVNLASARNFAVLAGSAITIAGPVNSTVIQGDIGVHQGTSITGTENLVLDGENHGSDGVTQLAKTHLAAAYTDADTREEDILFPAIHDIGGLTLISGVYEAPSSLAITGELTLDALGDPNAVWIFQLGSTLTTASNSKVTLINGAQAENVFWQVGTSATIGTESDFKGSILALQSITLTTDAVISGRVLAINGAVTMDNNTIAIPETGSSLLMALGFGLSALARRRKLA